MLASDLARAATQAVAATLLIAGVAEIWHLAVLAALYGAAEAFFRPAAGGLIPRLVPDEHLLQANSLIAMSQSLGMVLGPAIAGVLIALFGPGSAIAIDAVSFVVSAGCLCADVAAARRARGHLRRDRRGVPRAAARGLERGHLARVAALVPRRARRLPPDRAAVRARARPDHRRPRARRRVELGGDRDDVRDRLDHRRGDRAARRPTPADGGVRRSRSSARPASRRSSPGRAARWRSGRSSCWPASASRSASRCGRRRSAARSRPPRSRASPRSTGSPRSG